MSCTLVDCKTMDLEGTLSKLQTFGTWAKGSLATPSGEQFQVIGEALVGLTEHQRYVMSGSLSAHKQFGKQFRVEGARHVVDRDEVAAQLERLYAGCGQKTAKLLLMHFEERAGGLERLARAIQDRPWEIESMESVCGKRLRYIGAAKFTPRLKLVRTLEDRLSQCHINNWVVERLANWLEQKIGESEEGREAKAIELLMADPYAPLPNTEGYEFQEAESVAGGLGFPWNHSSRLAWIAMHAAQSASDRGHSYITIQQFSSAVKRLEERAAPKSCLDEAIAKGLPLVLDETRIYLRRSYEAEVVVADGFAAMVSRGFSLWSGTLEELESRIEHMESDSGTALDHSQREALIGLLMSKSRLHTLIARPGYGKTTVMEMIASLVPDVRFVAPTGIAAKVLASRVGKYGQVAQTIHAALEADGEEFKKGKENPILANLIVVDEAGMQDLEVCAALVRAMPVGAHLLLVGDTDQLDSVGVGRVLADVAEMPEPDHHTLSVPHRSVKGILDFIEAVRQGEVPVSPPDESVRYVEFDSEAEVRFDDVQAIWLASIKERGLQNVGLLFGHRRGSGSRVGMSVSEANVALQRCVNPSTKGNHLGGSPIRLNDRVLVKRTITLRRKGLNGKTTVYAQLVNGDVGYLRSVTRGEGGRIESALLQMDDGKEIELPGLHIWKLDLGYAQTVHSAQGSEFEEVIFVVAGRGNEFLNRRLLYTGSSRARKKLTVVGRRKDVESVAAYVAASRQSWLPRRIQESREYR